MARIVEGLGSLLVLVSMLTTAPAAMHAQAAASEQRATLAATPPMGWNSWNHFGCNVNEALIRRAADEMVASGMRDAGYQYIVIDDCWQGERDAAGNIQPDPKRFPSGIKALADYVHARGLKFGIYSDAGTNTCAGRPGSRGHEFQDARQYAAWGVDYLKYDWCHTGTQNAEASYRTMHEALLASGRPIVFSLCEWGTAKPWLWATGIGNLWRTTGDISDMWQGKVKHRNGMMDIVDMQVNLASFAGPGHWNDPDMLEVGNGGMTDEEYRSHFSLWAMLAAPLMAGNDLGAMSEATKTILTNREVIAIDQDPLGHEGTRVRKDGDLEVWARPIQGGNRAVILLNRDTTPHEITVRWTDLGYPDSLEAGVRDLWKHEDVGRRRGSYSATVPPHGVVMITVKP
ncbi:MAG TPA: glycoside hydrolase family 27 protein [Acidobacteriaceae bacterium]|jgi:alpha-galactosidase|nr:glycoside hydrolase family 27 protein [Acidobacteriaceae bacterium]